MSEIRQTVPIKNASTRRSVNFANASGDVVYKKCTTNQKDKNNIPKNLRYDLENALVGLCDVWFEEIKPYLIRNNIKVHTDAGGNQKHSATSPDCSHIDPGRSNHLRRRYVNYVGSSSTRPTVSKAPCHKLLVQQFPLATTENPVTPKIHRHNMKIETVRRPRKRRKCMEQTQAKHFIPRLCRTYSRQQYTEVSSPTIHSVLKIPTRNQMKPLQQKKKLQTFDASTQTEEPKKCVKNSQKIVARVNPAFPKFVRLPSTTNNSFPKRKKYRSEATVLKDDLVDMIAEKHDKMLEVLYTSPRNEEYPSIMNLFSPSEKHRKSKGRNRIPPWK